MKRKPMELLSDRRLRATRRNAGNPYMRDLARELLAARRASRAFIRVVQEEGDEKAWQRAIAAARRVLPEFHEGKS